MFATSNASRCRLPHRSPATSPRLSGNASDKDLVKAVADGDRYALRLLYRRHISPQSLYEAGMPEYLTGALVHFDHYYMHSNSGLTPLPHLPQKKVWLRASNTDEEPCSTALLSLDGGLPGKMTALDLEDGLETLNAPDGGGLNLL